MKRRSNPVGKQGRSPYQKYGKKPHVYSDSLRRWRSAIQNGRKDRDAADAWHWRFGSGKRVEKRSATIDQLVAVDSIATE